MIDGQLELGFAKGRGCGAMNVRQRRQGRANWWFQRMRQIVDRAIDWQPVPPARPEQIWFPGAHREAAVAAQERQICE